MQFTIKEVEVLTSQTGNGIKIGDKFIGCAMITNIEGDVRQPEFSKEVSVVQNPETRETTVSVDGDDIASGRNYVLVAVDGEADYSEVSIISTALDFTRIFGLPDEDAKTFDNYLPLLAEQRALKEVKYYDPEREEECFFFVNKYDSEIMEAFLRGDDKFVIESYVNTMRNPQFKAELSTHNFIKMMVISLVEAGENRYNKCHRDDVLIDVAKQLSEITYWENGVLNTPSVLDIDKFVTNIKSQIRVTSK